MSKQSFDHLKSIKKPAEKDTQPEYRTLSVRLDLNDARRFKSAADKNGFSNQTGLVEAINRLMAEWGEPAVAEVGSAGKGRKDTAK